MPFPAVKNSLTDGILTVGVFTIVTLFSMVGMVAARYFGLSFLKTDRLERYVSCPRRSDAFLSGLSRVFLDK